MKAVFKFIYLSLYACVCVKVDIVQKSTLDIFLSFQHVWIPGIELRASGLGSKCLHPLRPEHLASNGSTFFFFGEVNV